MYVNQISVFIENTTGRLAELVGVLGDNGINIRGVCVADTVDFGILRCIVNDPAQATKVLKAYGFTASITKVIAVELSDVPGGFATVLNLLKEAAVGVDYVYSINKIGGGAAGLIIKVDDPEKASKVLQKAGVKTYSSEDLAEN